MPAIPIIAVAVSAAATVYSTIKSSQASSQQATAAAQTANYNANVDIANAQQLQLDANANIAKQRQQDQGYLSQQRAAYAASGVLSDSGSPLAVQATTAGRMEQDIQQYWATTQEKSQSLYAAAAEGVYQGAEEASMYHLQGAAEIMKGIGSVANIAGSFANSPAGQSFFSSSSAARAGNPGSTFSGVDSVGSSIGALA